MALPNVGGGSQIGDGNTSEVQLGFMPAPTTATVTATLTTTQLLGGQLLGSPDSTAAAYTTPTGTAIDAVLVNAKIGSYFDLTIQNVDGSSTGVITLTAGTGVTISGLATVVATAGTSERWRFYRSAAATYTAYRQ